MIRHKLLVLAGVVPLLAIATLALDQKEGTLPAHSVVDQDREDTLSAKVDPDVLSPRDGVETGEDSWFKEVEHALPESDEDQLGKYGGAGPDNVLDETGDVGVVESRLRGAEGHGCSRHGQDCVACISQEGKCMFRADPGDDGAQCVPYRPPQAHDLSNAWAFNQRRAPVNRYSVLRFPEDSPREGLAGDFLRSAEGQCKVFGDQFNSMQSRHRVIRKGRIDCSNKKIWELNLDEHDDAWYRCAERVRVRANDGFTPDLVLIPRDTLFWHGTSRQDILTERNKKIFTDASRVSWLGSQSTARLYALHEPGGGSYIHDAFSAKPSHNPLRLLELSNEENLRWLFHGAIAQIRNELGPEDVDNDERDGEVDDDERDSTFRANKSVQNLAMLVSSFSGKAKSWNRVIFQAIENFLSDESNEETLEWLAEWPGDDDLDVTGVPYINRVSEYGSDAKMAKWLCALLKANERTIGVVDGYAAPYLYRWSKKGKVVRDLFHSEIMLCEPEESIKQTPLDLDGIVKVGSAEYTTNVPEID